MSNKIEGARIFEIQHCFETQLNADPPLFVRIELLADVAQENLFRCSLLRLDSYRVNPSFPEKSKTSYLNLADEEVWVDWSIALPEDLVAFSAKSVKAARQKVLKWLGEFAQGKA